MGFAALMTDTVLGIIRGNQGERADLVRRKSTWWLEQLMCDGQLTFEGMLKIDEENFHIWTERGCCLCPQTLITPAITGKIDVRNFNTQHGAS